MEAVTPGSVRTFFDRAAKMDFLRSGKKVFTVLAEPSKFEHIDGKVIFHPEIVKILVGDRVGWITLTEKTKFTKISK